MAAPLAAVQRTENSQVVSAAPGYQAGRTKESMTFL
jgi:hypothetical protein